MQEEKKTVILGKEYDTGLRDALLQTLRELGATTTDNWSGIGGSQEVGNLQVSLEGTVLVVEAETYIGLSVTGEPQLVDRVEELVRQRMKDVSG